MQTIKHSPTRLRDFSGQMAVVTGASRGIGRKIAEVLAEHGSHVVVTSRSEAEIEALAEEIRGRGQEALAVRMDVREQASVKSAVCEILKYFKKIDILVNNAGISRDNLLLRMKEKEWREVLSTNLDGVYRVTREVIPGMVRNRYGRIINIASVVAEMGNPGQVNYVASKAGIIGFTKALAREIASRNITVNAIAPGFIETEMTSQLGEKAGQQLRDLIPMKRIGTVEDVAWGVCFLASKEARYITGHVLNINGGMYM